MQQRSVYITAHDNGSVKGAVFGWVEEGNECSVVLPVPRYMALEPEDVLACLLEHSGAYWLDSYAALCGIDPSEVGSPEHLENLIDWRNVQWNGQYRLPGTEPELEVF